MQNQAHQSPWDEPEFKSRVAELISEGKSKDVAWTIAADELYPIVWLPPGIVRH
jgi:hypothetical protein